MKNKTIAILVIILLVGAGVCYYFYRTPDKCNEVGVLFIKPEEKDLVKNKNLIVSIPEENKLIASSEMLECESYKAVLDLNIGDLIK